MAKGKLVGIPPRKFDIDFSKIDVDNYYHDDKALTVFWNTLSMLFPEGEQFFVSSVRSFRDKIESERLQNEISGFIGQEAFHTKAHEQFNELLRAKGYPVDKVNKRLKKALNWIHKTNPLLALHATSILEHYTASMGIQLLEDDDHNGHISAEARKLWLMHANEEFEHRCVSFDVLNKVGGKYAEFWRLVLFIPVTIIFAAVTANLYAHNLRKQKVTIREMLSIFELVALLSENIPRLKDWFEFDFHPSFHKPIKGKLEKIKAEYAL